MKFEPANPDWNCVTTSFEVGQASRRRLFAFQLQRTDLQLGPRSGCGLQGANSAAAADAADARDGGGAVTDRVLRGVVRENPAGWGEEHRRGSSSAERTGAED
jgi:hypothetical protein